VILSLGYNSHENRIADLKKNEVLTVLEAIVGLSLGCLPITAANSLFIDARNYMPLRVLKM
jgi:hypothetical protein